MAPGKRLFTLTELSQVKERQTLGVGISKDLSDESSMGNDNSLKIGLFWESQILLPTPVAAKLLAFMVIITVKLLVFKAIAELGQEEWDRIS